MNFRQVHLDFHTSEKIEGIGTEFEKKQFQQALMTGHVNSITVFSKCHHGWAYHPSKANEMHPHLSFDLLGAQIEAAHEIGVKTPVYLSAGLDEKMASRHPEWLVRLPDESTTWAKNFSVPGYHKFCMNTPYLDYLLEQIKEVCQNYDADGIFLDIVGVQPCYCQYCIGERRKRGMDPYDSSDVLIFAQEVYANYTSRVRKAIDEVKPGLPVFHNGGHIRCGCREIAFSNTHLEIESLPTGQWGYDHFPISARYVQQLGLDYLGMTGKFHGSWGEFGSFKHPNALKYETALFLANGAKCSVGDQLHPSGRMDPATYELIGNAYKDVAKKEPWLDGVESVAEIALLSKEAMMGTFSTAQAARVSLTDAGALRILQEGHYLFDVVDAESVYEKYKIIILPDCIQISGALEEKIKSFIRGGGCLLATGKSGLDREGRNFKFDFGVRYIGECDLVPSYFKPLFRYENVEDTSYAIMAGSELVELSGGSELAVNEQSYFNRTKEHFCSHKYSPSSGLYAGVGMSEGRDGIYIAWPLFAEYASVGSLISKRIIMYALDRLLGWNKRYETNLPVQGIMTLMHQSGEHRYICHLLYASPIKRGNGIEVIEDIVPLYGVNVSLKLNERIKRVYLAPDMTEVPFEEKEGKYFVTVPKLECHAMVVFEY